jgi:hypothetical protein
MSIFHNQNGKRDFKKEVEYLLKCFIKNRDSIFEESLVIENKEGKKRRQHLVKFYNTWINVLNGMLDNPYYLENLPDIIWFTIKDEYSPSSESIAKFREKMYDVALHAKKKLPSSKRELKDEEIGKQFVAMVKQVPKAIETNANMELDKNREIDPTELKDKFKES